MEELLNRMSSLADEAGDWRDHLPYEAAVRYVEDDRFKAMYGSHVDACGYCRRLVDALHPPKYIEEAFVVKALDSNRSVDVLAATTNAWLSLDAARDVFVAELKNGPVENIRSWASVQKELAQILDVLGGRDSLASAPWYSTIALSLGGVAGAADAAMGGVWVPSAVERVTSYLLTFRYRVVHGGDLRDGGISERLFDVGRPFGRRTTADSLEREAGMIPEPEYGVLNYCAWPVHMAMNRSEFEVCASHLSRTGMVNCLTLDGEPRPYTDFTAVRPRMARRNEWEKGLAALRETMVQNSFAKIAIGGATDAGGSTVPMLVQDALVSLEHEHPLYVLGGFGGQAQEVAVALGLTDVYRTEPGSGTTLVCINEFEGWQCLHNGLDESENQQLAETDDVEQAMSLVLQGLRRLSA